MVAFVKFHTFVDEDSKGGHDFQNDTFNVALTNTAPTQATDTVWNTTVYPAPAAANGYTAGGNTLSKSSASTVSSVFKLVFADSEFTATSGGIGPFRYAVIYNSSKSNKVVGYYDYGSSQTLSNAGEKLTVDFDATNGFLQIS